MALLSKGILKNSYPELGAFTLRYITILMSEGTEFVFLSEDDKDILISEVYEVPVGIIKESYIIEGIYEREEL